MTKLQGILCTAAALVALPLMTQRADAQISIGINIGAPPVCPYGYFDYAPYNCAPYGYYGPQWFNGGVFLGAGPWFHGPRDFHGYVDRDYDPRFGYRGPFPGHGHYREPRDHFRNFHPTHERDGYGHEQEFRGNGHGYGRDQQFHGGDHGRGNDQGHGDHGHGEDHGHGH